MNIGDRVRITSTGQQGTIRCTYAHMPWGRPSWIVRLDTGSVAKVEASMLAHVPARVAELQT